VVFSPFGSFYKLKEIKMNYLEEANIKYSKWKIVTKLAEK
jgi:hypothetical protein